MQTDKRNFVSQFHDLGFPQTADTTLLAFEALAALDDGREMEFIVNFVADALSQINSDAGDVCSAHVVNVLGRAFGTVTIERKAMRLGIHKASIGRTDSIKVAMDYCREAKIHVKEMNNSLCCLRSSLVLDEFSQWQKSSEIIGATGTVALGISRLSMIRERYRPRNHKPASWGSSPDSDVDILVTTVIEFVNNSILHDDFFQSSVPDWLRIGIVDQNKACVVEALYFLDTMSEALEELLAS